MTTTINASTSSGLVVTPDNSGNIVLQYNGVAAPCFSAYLSNNQSISGATWTKVNLNVKVFDTASAFDNTTNYRFQPTVAGYYQINGALYITSSTTDSSIRSAIYKNGSQYVQGSWIYNPASMSDSISVVASVVYLNGSTDYVELFGYAGGTPTSPVFVGGSTYTYFNGCLLRGA
jgi:hypothetical protein